jgi:hypothetical protein
MYQQLETLASRAHAAVAAIAILSGPKINSVVKEK